MIYKNETASIEYGDILARYKTDLSNFNSAIDSKKTDTISNTYDSQRLILEHATIVYDCLLSYQKIIDQDLAKDQRWAMTSDEAILVRQIKTVKMVVSVINLCQELLTATGDEREGKRLELLKYVQKTLTSNPTISHRIYGVLQILGGLLLAAATLVVAVGYFGIALSPAVPLAIVIACIVWASALSISSSVFAVCTLYLGINTFMDRDPNRNSLHDKLTAYINTFSPKAVKQASNAEDHGDTLEMMSCRH